MPERAAALLKEMIRIPSLSFEEADRAAFLRAYLAGEGIRTAGIKNNIAALCRDFNPDKPTLMLNSHIDTVKAAESYTVDPFGAQEKDGTIYGLGSNDAGASVVSMIHTFLYFNEKGTESLPVNLMLLLTAEEERSGPGGMDLVMKTLAAKKGEMISFPVPDFAIIGEPTGMKAAVAERGLLVLDGTAKGISGHAARNEGVNALYIAIEDIEKLRNYRFDKISPLMGSVKLTVTQIQAGTTHNVIPDRCTFVTDIRPTEQYENREIWELLQKEVKSELTPRNLSNRTSVTPLESPLMKTVGYCDIGTFVSPTTSDWMRLNIPAIKMGPGDSARSHKADEFIRIREIGEGIAGYIRFTENLKL